MNNMVDIDVFDNDERIIVNKACEGVNVLSFSRDAFLAHLTFARNISTEQDILGLLDGLIAKVEHISDVEWDNIKSKVPFATYYDAESNVDEVPIDEAV